MRRLLIAAGVAALALFASYIVIYGPVSTVGYDWFSVPPTAWYNYYLVLNPPVSVSYNVTAYNVSLYGGPYGPLFANFWPHFTVYYYPPASCGPAGVYQVAGQCFNETPILLVNETCRPPPVPGPFPTVSSSTVLGISESSCIVSAVLNKSGLYRVGVDYLCTGYCG